jgi:hypothetical protein
MARVGLLFPLCGMAHQAALGAALAAAGATLQRPMPALEVLLEQVEAFAWRFGLDLPPLVGFAPDPQGVVRVRRAAAEVRAGRQPAKALLPLMADLIDGHGLAARLLAFAHELDQRGFGFTMWPALGEKPASWFDWQLAHLSDFGQRPEADDGPAEVGAGAGEALTARLRAQMDAALALPARIALLQSGAPSEIIRSASLTRGAGTGLAETTRGPLAYRVMLEEGRLASAASVAPTEWNFHPEGPCVDRLHGVPGPHKPETITRFVAGMLDPCVPVSVAVAPLHSRPRRAGPEAAARHA